MRSFSQFVLLRESSLDYEDIKDIVFNALGLDAGSIDAKKYLGNNLSDYDSRKEILHSQAIQKLPNYEEIKKIVLVDYKNYTIGTLINKIQELSEPFEV